ncbi:MAG: Rieske (2Fe-2S) protein [Chloroflexi bacterium]|nr:Rieske (2Fe-2S) protein [Chloroflexota bacterium]
MTEQEKPDETPEADAGEQPAAEQPAAEQPATRKPDAAAAEKPAEPAAKPAEKKQPEPAKPAGPVTAVVDAQRVPGTPIVPRRAILKIGFWSGIGAAVAGTAAGGLDFVYPRGVSGFGGTVSISADAVPAPGEKVQIPVGRFWLVNLTEEQGGPGLLALWWKCPHLGCTIPWKPGFSFTDPGTGADKKGWFRCPCHGSTFTDAGIRVFGPSPRPLDTMALSVGADGRVSVNTGSITNGAPDNAARAVRI